MRLALVLALSLSSLACGGTVEPGEPSPAAVGGRPALPALPLASVCGDTRVRARVPRTARALTASGSRFAFIDATSDGLPGSVVVHEGARSTIVANGVEALSGSRTIFAFTFAGGGLGAYREATSLRPGVNAFGIAADLAHLVWAEPTDEGFVLRRGDLDGAPETIAEQVFPVFAVDAGTTWFATWAPNATTIHRKVAHEASQVVAADLPGLPSKMIASGDRAFVALGDENPLLKEVGGDAAIDLWQGPMVDFAADVREVVVGLDRSIARIPTETRTAEIVDLGACAVRSIAMNDQEIFVLARPEEGDAVVVGLAR